MDYVILLLLLVAGWLFGWLLSQLLRLVPLRLFTRIGSPDPVRQILRKATQPFALGIGALLMTRYLWIADLPTSVSSVVGKVLTAIAWLFFIGTVYRFTDIIALRLFKHAEATESKSDDMLVPLIDKTLKFVVIAVGLLFTLQALGLDITALLAGVSIGGLAVAFAAQDTIKNLFGSVLILTDKPFTIGDWINVDGKEGVIEEIGFRSTRIRTFADSIVIVPNGRLADLTIDNMGLRQLRRYQTTLGLEYDTTPEKIEAFVAAVRQAIVDHPDTVKGDDKMSASFFAFDASSLNILVQMYFEVSDLQGERRAREQLNLTFLRIANELGVGYAFPTQTIHVASVPPPNS